jgi:hypothetical protein
VVPLLTSDLTTNVLNITLSAVFLFVSQRAFYLYAQIRSARLCILGLSMGLIALTALMDFLSSIVTTVHLSVGWFLYIGQAISYMFVLLNITVNSESKLRRILRWHCLLSVILLGLLVLSPVLPDFPNPGVRLVLSGSRCVICFIICFYYISLFMSKGTRFSLFMAIAFMLLSFGYMMLLPKYMLPGQEVLDHVGDVIRILGVVTMGGGFIWSR